MKGKLTQKNIKEAVKQLISDLSSPASFTPIHCRDQALPVVGCPLKPGMILTFLSVLKINITPEANIGSWREQVFSIAAAFLSFPIGKN